MFIVIIKLQKCFFKNLGNRENKRVIVNNFTTPILITINMLVYLLLLFYQRFLKLSVQFSLSVVSDSATPWTTARQASLSIPGAYSNPCLSSQWCHLTISSSVGPFSSSLQSLPASGSSPMSQFFTSGDQSIAVSASASVLWMNVQEWFPLGWTAWMSLQ